MARSFPQSRAGIPGTHASSKSVCASRRISRYMNSAASIHLHVPHVTIEARPSRLSPPLGLHNDGAMRVGARKSQAACDREYRSRQPRSGSRRKHLPEGGVESSPRCSVAKPCDIGIHCRPSAPGGADRTSFAKSESKADCYDGRVFNFGKPKTAGDWIAHVLLVAVALFLLWWICGYTCSD